MDSLFLKILNMSITAGWLILAILVLRLLLKKAPRRLTFLLWAVLALRLIFPFSIESKLSLVPSVETVSPEILFAEKPEIHSGIPAVNSFVNPRIQESLSPTPAAGVNPLQIRTRLAACIWLAGMTLLLLYAFLSYWRLKRKLRTSIRLEDNIWISDEIDTPFILGLFKARIYLPSGMDPEQKDPVLAHERAHLARGDHFWKPLAFLLLAIYWFNPLFWLAYVLLCRDIEVACDEKIIRSMEKEERLAYSQALLAGSVSHRSVMSCPLAFGELAVKERIRSVLNYRKPAFWIILLALIASVALGIAFLTNPKEAVPTEPGDPTAGESDPEGSNPPVTAAEAVEWLNVLAVDYWPESMETSLAEFPGVVFRWTADRVEAVSGDKVEVLYNGMPVWDVFFCDLTGDGRPELCSTVSFGSGIVDDHIVVYDYAEKVSYALSGRLVYDYRLFLDEGHLCVSKSPYRGQELPESGLLLLEDGNLLMQGDSDPLPKDPDFNEEMHFRTYASPVGYSEAGYDAMVDLAVNRDIERPSGTWKRLVPLLKLDSRDDLDSFCREMSAFFDLDAADEASPAFLEEAKAYTEEFFSKNTVFVSYVITGSSADYFEIVGTYTDEKDTMILALRSLENGTGDAVMGGYFLVAETDKSYVSAFSAYDALLVDSGWPETGLEAGRGKLSYRYIWQGQDDMDYAVLQLFDSGDFLLSLSPLSSYLGYGSYVYEGEQLILKTDDGKYSYVFDRQGEAWNFNTDLSSPLFWYSSGITDGSAFSSDYIYGR